MKLLCVAQLFLSLLLGIALFFFTKDSLLVGSFLLGAASDGITILLMARVMFSRQLILQIPASQKKTERQETTEGTGGSKKPQHTLKTLKTLKRFYLGELLKLISTVFCFMIPLFFYPQLKFNWFLTGFFLSRIVYVVALMRVVL